MWILKFLPDFVFHLIFIGGLLGLGASFILKFVPFVTQYRVVIQVVASIMIAVGLYMEGAISDNTAWVERVHALEKKVAEAEAKSADANTQLISRLAAKQKEIAAAQADAHSRVQQAAASIDAVCPVPATVISILNDATGSKK
jgi:enamine deaminase RidA (YjgF/YER057c/UK114 family)